MLDYLYLLSLADAVLDPTQDGLSRKEEKYLLTALLDAHGLELVDGPEGRQIRPLEAVTSDRPSLALDLADVREHVEAHGHYLERCQRCSRLTCTSTSTTCSHCKRKLR